ncbi:hypothetical protein HY389_01740 [Candidatus Daviesbacteria bacterium]|nr:hypothetical protein [Candidatus Daviesbacteria bacterium]
MTATAHALVGGAIAASVPDPTIGLTLSAASHPIMDLIPHWDFGWGWRSKTKVKLFAQASFDLALGFILAYFLFGRYTNNFWYFMAAVFASEIWDMLEAPYWFFNWRFPPFSWIYNIQHRLQGKVKLPWGILTQVAVVIVVVIALQTLPTIR